MAWKWKLIAFAAGVAAGATFGCSTSEVSDPGSGGAGARVGAGGGSGASGGTRSGGSGGSIPAASGGTNNGGTTNASMSGGATEGGAADGGTRSGTGGNLFGSGGRSGTGGNGSGTGGGSGDSQPALPPISGSCPVFQTGTATIGGLAGISLQVGAKSPGTGPLLFYWHGTGSTANEVNLLVPATVRKELLAQGGIIVSFGESLGTGGDCSGTATFSKDDFKIADLIAACAVRDYGIDPRRIYTTGCSAGGLQAGCMGALRSSYIAATVPNSGGAVTQQKIETPGHTPAVMTMHGGTSDVVVVAFSTTSATYDAQMKQAGSFVVNCNHGGGHCQAPSELYSAGWEFMKAHPYGAKPEPYASGLPATFPSYCSVYQ